MDNLGYIAAGYGVSLTLIAAYALGLRRRLVETRRRLARDRADGGRE